MQNFVDREGEQKQLTSSYESETAEFIVMYGRRRLGKSELVRQTLRGRKDAVYYQAIESTAENQLDNFVETVTAAFPELENVRRDWEVLLEELGKRDAIVIIDEFPFLIEEDESLPSRIQRVWDLELQNTGMTLVLIGSSISVMEEKVLAGGSPLYGRRTATIDLGPLSVENARDFFPKYDPETAIKAWATYGGTPYYLQTIDADRPLAEISKMRSSPNKAYCTQSRSSYPELSFDSPIRISVSFGHWLTGGENRTRSPAWRASIRVH